MKWILEIFQKFLKFEISKPKIRVHRYISPTPFRRKIFGLGQRGRSPPCAGAGARAHTRMCVYVRGYVRVCARTCTYVREGESKRMADIVGVLASVAIGGAVRGLALGLVSVCGVGIVCGLRAVLGGLAALGGVGLRAGAWARYGLAGGGALWHRGGGRGRAGGKKSPGGLEPAGARLGRLGVSAG